MKLRRFFPIVEWLPKYTFSKLMQDFLAGITVGMTEIPQAVAYAAIAGLPPEYGLYSGLIDGFIYVILGGCKALNVGPSSVLSLLIYPPVSKFGPVVAPLMTFFSGGIIFLLGILHLGFVTRFFSYPVIAGYICSGCLLIGFSQFKTMVGISGPTDNIIVTITSIVTNFREAKLWDFILGICSIILIVGLKKMMVFAPKNFFGKIMFFLSIGANALTLVLGTTISYFSHEKSLLQITGNVTEGFPNFQSPSFSIFPELATEFGVTLTSLFLLSLIEATATTRALSKGVKIDSSVEMLALGLCNIAGSFIGSMPVTGSFSRSIVNEASGVKTTLSGVFTSLLLLLVIAFLSSTFYYVPKATLSAILITAIFYIYDYQAFGVFWRTKKSDYIPFLTTFICGLLLSLDYAILIGAAVNLLFILYANVHPKFDIFEEKKQNSDRVIYTIIPKDTIFYTAAEFLRDKAIECEGSKVTVVLNGKYISSIDVTVAKNIAMLTKDLIAKNYNFVMVDFKNSVKKVCIGVDKNLKDYFMTEEETKNCWGDDGCV